MGELAHHWFSATRAQDLDKALDYSRRAAEAALASLAPGDALHYYAQALEILAQINEPDPVVGIDLAIGLGTAQRQVGEPAYRQTLLDAARRASDLGDPERLVAAALAIDRGVGMFGSRASQEVEVFGLALANLPPHHPDRPVILAMLCSERAESSFARRQALAEEAIDMAEASGDDHTMVRVLNHIALPLRVPQLLDRSLSWSEEALTRAKRIDDPVLTFWSASARQVVALGAGDIEEADRMLSLCGRLSDELDQPTLHWANLVQLGTRAQVAGDTERAQDLADEALRVGTNGSDPDAPVVYGAQLMAVSWQRGTLPDLVPLIEQALADSHGVPGVGAALALAYVESGDFEHARSILERAAPPGFNFPLRGAWLSEMVLSVEVITECEDVEAASVILDQLAPCTGQFACGGRGAEGPVDHSLGRLVSLLGDHDRAEHYFAQSAMLSQRMGAKFFAARTDLHWGRLLAKRDAPGDIEMARWRLARALTIAEAHGYESVRRRVETSIRELV